MGFFDTIFKKPGKAEQLNKYFTTLDGYTPAWTTYEGGVYEMELTRACIHAFATHVSKLQPAVEGADLRKILPTLNGKPNPFMVSAQFLYKCATILETSNTCYIVPLMDRHDRTCGYYPVRPVLTELIEYAGEPWLRYTFGNGKKAAVEMRRAGILNKFTLHSDIVGDDNRALNPTMDLLSMQNQGIKQSIKNGAAYRLMATLNNFAKTEDAAKERKKFSEQNLGEDGGGILLLPNTYTNTQQLRNDMQAVDPEQMRVIETRVYDYFGSNEDVLQNKTVGDSWSAYYEGKIEPFAVLLSQVMTGMTYSNEELTRGNAIVWTSNRLQYAKNTEKLTVSSQMFDRGILTTNQIMDIWNLPHVEDGDKRFIRREYVEVSKLDKGTEA